MDLLGRPRSQALADPPERHFEVNSLRFKMEASATDFGKALSRFVAGEMGSCAHFSAYISRAHRTSTSSYPFLRYGGYADLSYEGFIMQFGVLLSSVAFIFAVLACLPLTEPGVATERWSFCVAAVLSSFATALAWRGRVGCLSRLAKRCESCAEVRAH